MLAASGELDDRPGGPYVPTDRTDSGEVAVDESTPGATRRSVYLQQRRTQVASLLDVFDAPSIVTTCTRRLPSTVPLQSLSLLNSGFVVARAGKLAQRLDRDCGADAVDARIARAFLLVVGRGPSRRQPQHRIFQQDVWRLQKRARWRGGWCASCGCRRPGARRSSSPR